MLTGKGIGEISNMKVHGKEVPNLHDCRLEGWEAKRRTKVKNKAETVHRRAG